ncbi:hypothetical protein ACJJTC_011427 [Scirpophaga incertulas]
MLGSLYALGTDATLTHDRKYLKTEIERNKPALGSCLGAFSSTFPVAFLEPHLNKHNQFSLLNRIADHSLEAQDIMAKMEQSMPTLETILSEVDQFVESDKTYNEAPHIIDVVLPLLCSYLPFLVGTRTRQCYSYWRQSRHYGDSRTHEPAAEECSEADQEEHRQRERTMDDTHRDVYTTDYNQQFGGAVAGLLLASG